MGKIDSGMLLGMEVWPTAADAPGALWGAALLNDAISKLRMGQRQARLPG